MDYDAQSLIDAREHPFVLIDRNYTIIAANRAYRVAYGLQTDDITGRKCHELSHHSATPCHMQGEHCPHLHVMRSGEPDETVHVHFDAQGQPEHVRLKGYPIHDGQGNRLLGEEIHRMPAPVQPAAGHALLQGLSPRMLQVRHDLDIAAQTDEPVLIEGESGTGKELAAQALHQASARAERDFIVLDCTTIPEALFESEFFGHEGGAFTGASARKTGLFELADGGTLFLDEIGELTLPQQCKLLRALESGEFRRVGSNTLRRADVRVVAATNRSLARMVQEGSFRSDLYFRLSVFSITLPPLRDRPEDIPILARYLLARMALRPHHTASVGLLDGKTETLRPLCGCGATRWELTPEALRQLVAYPFPGNVRELRNILARAAATAVNGRIDACDLLLPAAIDDAPVQGIRSKPVADGASRIGTLSAEQLHAVLSAHHGHRGRAAQALGISERTLYRKLRDAQSSGRPQRSE
ncbi:MAG: sigma-54 interaction domain-containing protein [Thiomonas sp.]